MGMLLLLGYHPRQIRFMGLARRPLGIGVASLTGRVKLMSNTEMWLTVMLRTIKASSYTHLRHSRTQHVHARGRGWMSTER